MTEINGPLAAVRVLSSLIDDIAEPIINQIDGLAYVADEVKATLKKDIEDTLVDVFMGDKITALRQYIYDQWREAQP